jgi:hypothetical protein
VTSSRTRITDPADCRHAPATGDGQPRRRTGKPSSTSWDKHAFTDDFGTDLNIFYKDIRNLLGSEFVNTYNGAQYARLSNSDFADANGFTVALDHRSLGPLAVALDYTWQRVKGNASDPWETATRAEAGEDPRPASPLGWDQRHTST